MRGDTLQGTDVRSEKGSATFADTVNRMPSLSAGTLYEERLREFHFKVHRRTSWSKRRVDAHQTDADTLATSAMTKEATGLQRDMYAS